MGPHSLPQTEFPTLPTFYVSHGGGPSFLMDSGRHGHSALELLDKQSPTAKALRELVATELSGTRPRAVVVVSAHHETDGGHEVLPLDDGKPGLYYDYYGFPEEMYHLSWSPRGSAAVASEVLSLLKEAGVPIAGPAKADGGQPAERGYDHGVFIPLMQVFPDPPPMVQVSLDSRMDAAAHLRLGAALAPLRRRGVLVVGSGFLAHNLPVMVRARVGGSPQPWFAPFERWVDGVVGGGEEDGAANKARAGEFREWAKAPGARGAHPREEHLLPLHVVATAGSGNADSVPRGKIVFRHSEPSVGLLSAIVRYD